VAIDREDTLKKAEKLVRQGKLDAAIAEYLKVVEDHPADWATANTLGDLYVRAGQPDMAAAQYARIGRHFKDEGFYPKAGAIYKKLLKLTPDDEAVQLTLAEISQRQGLLADAKAQLNAVAGRRRGRGDQAGAAAIVIRLGSVDPADFDARTLAARTMAETGDPIGAADLFRGLYNDLIEKGRETEALQALRQAVELVPDDQEARLVLARTAVLTGDFEGARAYLDRQTAGDDPTLQMALLEMDLRAGDLEEARGLLRSLLAMGADQRQRVTEMAWATSASSPDAAFVAIDALADAAVASGAFDDAAALLQEFASRIPNQVPALLKLIDVCVDGGLEAAMYEAQAQLADAYLSVGQAAEARVIAENLVAREPWERAHIDRFRRVLMMLRVPDPDLLIASRLSGEVPFTARDVFADRVVQAPVPEPEPSAHEEQVEQAAPPQPAREPEPEPIEAPPAAPGPPRIQVSSLEPEPAAPAEEIDLDTVLGDFSAAPEPAPRIPVSTMPPLSGDIPGEGDANRDGDQSAQHMTLARTYLEMGLTDEAIGPLETASKMPRFRFEAASQLGRIYRDRGDTSKAVEWLERAAEAPAPSDDESRALLYDLGAMVEANGETARALAVFLELQSEAGDYRDVAARVERLARVETGG
jgi:tetratricopeptide (TPR) repeat protein